MSKSTPMLPAVPPLATHESLRHAAGLASGFAANARSERTRSAYRWQWRRFAEWCHDHGLSALPAEAATVALYLSASAEAGLGQSTLSQGLAAITEAHRVAGHPSPREAPQVRETWKGIRRALGTRCRQVDPLLAADLVRVVDAIPGGLIGLRDRALLLVGFAGAFRRGELVAVTVDELSFTQDGLVIALARSKADQEGAGVNIGIPFGASTATCPVSALSGWLESAQVVDGNAFRAVSRHGGVGGALQGRDVARVVKRRVAAVGLDPDSYSGHSLRSGLATTAIRAGKSERAVMRQGRWASRAMVDRYVRDATLFGVGNAAAKIGL